MAENKVSSHKYGDPLKARLKFSKKVSQTCFQLSPELSRHFNLQHIKMTAKYVGSNTPKFDCNEIDGVRQQNYSNSKEVNLNCNFCGSTNQRRFRLKPKAKTSNAIIRLMKKYRTQTRSENQSDGLFEVKGTKSKFKDRMLMNYFKSPNQLFYQCSFCKQVMKRRGEKRAAPSFIERHSTNTKRRKLLHKQSDMKNKAHPVSTEKNQHAIVDKPISSSFIINNDSPMQAFKANSELSNKSVKRIVQPRVASTKSKAILKKFQQDKVGKMFKSQLKNKPNKKTSDLELFLNSVN